MIAEEHYRKLENLYHTAPCNVYYQPRLTIREGAATLVIPIREELFHGAGATHGAAYFKAMDDASFFAANSLVEDVFVLTVQFNVHFLRPVTEGEITAEAKIVQAARSQLVAEARLTDSEGRDIGCGTGSFLRSKIKLSPEIGYSLA